eukprot:7265988-Lingulodinium_polyedra.AAC.1
MTTTLLLAWEVTRALSPAYANVVRATVTPASILAAPNGPVKTNVLSPQRTPTKRLAMNGGPAPRMAEPST